MDGALSTNDQLMIGNPRRSRAVVLLAVTLTLTLCVTLLVPALSASAANEVPYRDLDRAQQEFEFEVEQKRRLEMSLEQTERDLATFTSSQAYAIANVDNRLSVLSEWRDRARRLAIESYIAGGPADANLHLLDAGKATDVTYRSVLLRTQAEAAVDASSTYARLLDGADDSDLTLLREIDAVLRRAEGIQADLARTEKRIADAEWVVTIAAVHRLADEEFEKSGRRDPTLEDWADLRFCESTNRYAVNTGNGFYGAYQFDYQTWFTVGGTPGTRADQAPPEEQDARARLLYSRRGSQPWPECGWRLDS